ncbi:hypothetical protein JMJ77_0012969, partial [Colletotrichum scovillei]
VPCPNRTRICTRNPHWHWNSVVALSDCITYLPGWFPRVVLQQCSLNSRQLQVTRDGRDGKETSLQF